MGLRDSRRERARQDAEERAELEVEREAELDGIAVSTLSTAPAPFEQVAVLWGVPDSDEATALRSLKETAYAEECDAVIGVGFCGIAVQNPFGNQIGSRFLAYGTGIRWVDESEDD